MMAPMPSATSDQPPSVRLSVPSPVAAASAIRRSIDLVRNSEPATSPSVATHRRNRDSDAQAEPIPDYAVAPDYTRCCASLCRYAATRALWITVRQQIADDRHAMSRRPPEQTARSRA